MIRLGVIGVQGYGLVSLKAVAERRQNDATVTALCDINEQAARRIAANHAIPFVFADYRELLASPAVDAVIIATPHFLHHPMTLAALAAGKHVFCEKPLAITEADANEMVAAAKNAERVLTCHYNQRTTPKIQALRALIARGELGDVYHATARWRARWTGFMFHSASKWRTEQTKAGGGIFIGRGSHLMDAILYILDEPRVAAVHALMQNRLTGFEVEDYAAATLYLENGATVQIECSYALPTPGFHEEMQFEIFGTRGGVTYRQHDDNAPVWGGGRLDLANGAWEDRSAAFENAAAGVASDSVLDNFLDAIQTGAPLIVTARAAARTTTLIAAGYRSARSRQVVSLAAQDA